MRRSMLFIPGNSPNLLQNCDVLGSDSVILDLEDAVSPAEKDSERILVRNFLSVMDRKNAEVIIRINSVDTAFCEEDLKAIMPYKPNIIMPPKSSSKEDISINRSRWNILL